MSALSFPFGGQQFIQGSQLESLLFGPPTVKGPLGLPQTATATLFTVSGGAILVTSFVGVVTTATPVTANTLSIGTAPSVGTAEAAGIASATSIASLAVGTWIAMPATPGAAGASLVAPAVPLTTVPVVNPYHGSVAVTVTGGTVTAVFVGGVQVGSGDGTYVVPQHETISITYSVAPTWTWAPATALQIGAGSAVNLSKEHVVSPGTITWTTSASVAGAIKWYLTYIPLDGSSPGVPTGVAVS